MIQYQTITICVTWRNSSCVMFSSSFQLSPLLLNMVHVLLWQPMSSCFRPYSTCRLYHIIKFISFFIIRMIFEHGWTFKLLNVQSVIECACTVSTVTCVQYCTFTPTRHGMVHALALMFCYFQSNGVPYHETCKRTQHTLNMFFTRQNIKAC